MLAVSRERRILNQPGFVLHSWPYKETSLIVEIFTRDYGRIALVAKGAKRPILSCAVCCKPFSLYSWGGLENPKSG
jgi:DNA repair protein RecO